MYVGGFFSSQALQTFFMPFMWILIDLHMCSLLTQFTDILNINTLTARDVETSPIPHNRPTNQHTTGPARSLDSAFQRTEYPCGIVVSSGERSPVELPIGTSGPMR